MNFVESWKKLEKLPFGKKIFSKLVGKRVPYSGSIGAEIIALQPGFAELTLRERRKVQNHLGSVHAVALMNLGELTTGLALIGGLDPRLRAIVTKFRIEYFKKARGLLRARCQIELPTKMEKIEKEVSADILNEAGEVVCRATATWLIGPKN